METTAKCCPKHKRWSRLLSGKSDVLPIQKDFQDINHTEKYKTRGHTKDYDSSRESIPRGEGVKCGRLFCLISMVCPHPRPILHKPSQWFRADSDDPDPLVHAYNPSTVAPLQMFIFFLLLSFSVLLGLAKLNSLRSLLTSNTLLTSHSSLWKECSCSIQNDLPLDHQVLCKAESLPWSRSPPIRSPVSPWLSPMSCF